jgi:HlyD family secretion protein
MENRQMKELDSSADIGALIGASKHIPPARFLFWRWIGVSLAIAVTVTGMLYLRGASGNSAPSYLTTPVSRGGLVITVTATGATEPRNEVSVGIEVSGTIAEVLVDHNDIVKKGDPLARLDTKILSAEVAQAQASLLVTRATQKEAEATFVQSENELARKLKLNATRGGTLTTAQEMEAARADHERAAASLESAKAQVAQAEAQLAAKQTELAKAEVISPINGIVLARRVDPGQTVAAALQTPELFVIAEDLTEMELRIEIDEADVGQVRERQPAVFTVDAYPDEEFAAEITQLRYAPISSAGVVTYEAILSVDNSDMRLRPGMTATAIITVRRIDDTLVVPNAALRFSPRARDTRRSDGGGITGALIPRIPTGSMQLASPTRGKQRMVWVLDETNESRPVKVVVGATDGVSTQVLSGDLAEGAQVITEEADPS